MSQRLVSHSSAHNTAGAGGPHVAGASGEGDDAAADADADGAAAES